MNLEDFLNAKPLYYDEIDYGRMPRVYERVKSNLPNLKIIHLIGTNGKGTTGRFLASALHSLDFKTAHYTSPHILNFNERVWLNGIDASNEELALAHRELQKLLSKEESDSLSYFEYTTLLAVLIFKDCDYVVMEAGLGGEFDATAVFDKVLTLVTPIGIDHEAFLGTTIEEISRTKLNAIKTNAILANQNFSEVYKVANHLELEKKIKTYKVDDFISPQDNTKINSISNRLELPIYLKENLKLAISALNFLKIAYSEENFEDSRLFGRLTQLTENIIVDVGHNTLAANSVLTALDGGKYTLIYNSYKDKDYKEILSILKPIIDNVEIITIESERGALEMALQTTLNDLEIQYSKFKKIESNREYLVFGSFSVVEAFLKEYRG